MTELAAAGAPIRVPVAVSFRVWKLHRQHYYAWLAQPVTDAEHDEAYVANALFDAHSDDPEFGYRLLHDEITATGHNVSECTVWKLCSSNEWWCVFGKKRRSRKARPGTPAHEDLVCREFIADDPNQLWLTDISHQRGQALHLRCQGRVVGPDRGLLHRRPHDLPARPRRAGISRRPSRRQRRQLHVAQRSWRPISQ
ncbi:hypothetical protein FB384_005145 [Prauserella sediminis]|uniref:Helix-turn-helix protein n=1 Tax=Prauserella sediminis TaxID=577680 RepID=A0A839XXU8_9PSEU|nr:hypothetical protein [Prauserella sediminis]